MSDERPRGNAGRPGSKRPRKRAKPGRRDHSNRGGGTGENGRGAVCSGGWTCDGEDGERRIRAAAAIVAALGRQARVVHRGDRVAAKTAVLDAWRGLAGVPAWTPAMVRVVERELGR